ncbi:hypothetical protein [Anaeromicrobium sediminis]|uniref:Uncharacterized protein n=1 Tax=Anaeromicrobium sediminis TaxID=1478221 RepID=A0A267MNW6_9FIRM|nr:hypothetical protein [Anaeromicrobium sediminis]PAB60618.1 hypothetical protein CCE28_03500 [Anaeromicrobium sediminis]
MESRREKKKGSSIWISILIFIVSAGVWSAVAYYGYTYAKDYIDTSIQKVQQENALNIKGVNEQIQLLTGEIKDLRSNIRDTDDSISDSAEVQEEIDDKLKSLDSQLKKLESSLKILQEAPNVKN